MGWISRELGFKSQEGRGFSLQYHVQISCGSRLASYPVGTGSSLLVMLTTHLCLVLRLRMPGAMLDFPIRIHDVVLD
jgi:hypothetical protein